MWYAIEYANNGNKSDQVYEFTRRSLRDAWVADSPSDVNAPGARLATNARMRAVRNADYKHDGDRAAYAIIAAQRVDASPALARYREILITYEWTEADHLKWVATAPEREIVSWAKEITSARNEVTPAPASAPASSTISE